MRASTQRSAASERLSSVGASIVVLVALVVVCTVITHSSAINGPWYWKWAWRRIPLRRYWIMLLPAVPFAAAQWLSARRGIAICLLMFCAAQLRITDTILQDEHLGLDWLAATVRSSQIVSYYGDAAAIGQDPRWLADYPQILRITHLHTRTKPPGPVSYYLSWIHLAGYGDRSAKLAGLGVIGLETLVIPLTFLLARSLTQDESVAFAAVSFISLCPGAVLLLPMLDPVYAAFTCLILYFWDRGLQSCGIVPALLCGICVAAGLFCSYSLMTLGIFVLMQTFLLRQPRLSTRSLIRAILLAAGGGVALFYAALWIATRFDPIATFRTAWDNQHELLLQHRQDRPYPATVVFDLTDFALAMGWAGATIVLIGVSRVVFNRSADIRKRYLMAACFAQPAAVAIAGILQSETLRVWNFMLPLMAVAAGIELAAWAPGTRAVAYVAMFTVLWFIGQNLQF